MSARHCQPLAVARRLEVRDDRTGTRAEIGRRRGAARRAAAASRVEAARLLIERTIPNFDLLDEETLEIIETNAETVLQEIGVAFVENPAALDRWREAVPTSRASASASRGGSRAQLCATAPSQLHAARPQPRAKACEIGGNNLVLAPVYGPPFVRDAMAAAAMRRWRISASS